MENKEYFDLPDLITLSQFDNDYPTFLEAVYALFKRDFVDNKPVFRGIRLGLKKHPMSLGKEATFWHMTSEGEDEQNREVDINRMERVEWPAPLINHSEHSYLKVWENKRGSKENILILHEAEGYLVILRKVKDYLLPWTAYSIDYPNRKARLLKEYEDYIKCKKR
ncbi:MAG: hypothetical protein ACRCZY_11990 [Phocaeicola sp.]